MAIFYPDINEILKGKVTPEPGELHLLYFLEKTLNDDYEVFFNPYMNGDRPDIIIIKPNQGILIIEVKDYRLEHYAVDTKTKNWKVLTKTGTHFIKSPISQVLKYKTNLFDLHIEDLHQLKISDIRNANIVSCAVYFHNATEVALNNLLVEPFKNDFKYTRFLNYNILLLGKYSLEEKKFLSILRRRHLAPGQLTSYFPDELYFKIKRFMLPPLHQKTDGKHFHYNDEQQKIIFDRERTLIRLKGVVGSGKTTVLAARAVELQKRTEAEVLILTYNKTLLNYVHDKINNVRENFPWTSFVISNYHDFINIELNNVGVDVCVPDDFGNYSDQSKEKYFEETYYSNISLFEENKVKFKKYSSILIDEIQDYKYSWMEIIKTYFLKENGYYMVFGDDKQNIYGNPVTRKFMAVNMIGRPSELKKSYRGHTIIKELTLNFQNTFLADKYDIDNALDFKGNANDLGLFDGQENLEGTINYMFLPSANEITSLYTIIHENSLNKGVHPNDITILGIKIKLLKEFDAHYRHRSGEKSNTMFETEEDLLLMGMNYEQNEIKYNTTYWINFAFLLLKFNNPHNYTDGFRRLAELLVCKTQMIKYPEFFESRYLALCNKNNISTANFDDFFVKYNHNIKAFISKYNAYTLSGDAKRIRDNKKIHFWANRGTVKLSTVHSFKGWESDLVYLIIENINESMTDTFFELIYTGLTRARSNLIILNYGNETFHKSFLPVYEKTTQNL